MFSVVQVFTTVLCALLLAAPSARAWSLAPTASDPGIPSRGGIPATATNVPAQPYFLQADPAWGTDRIGGSDELMREAGCAVCCVSMAFAHLGLALDPKALNVALKAHDAYSASGQLKWRDVERVTADRIRFELLDAPSHAAIDAALFAERPVVAKILRDADTPHWVLIVGKDGEEYLVKDPDSRTRELRRLSALAPRIHAIRIATRHQDVELP